MSEPRQQPMLSDVEQHLMQAYLNNRLSADEEAAFELRLLADPELAMAVQLEQLLLESAPQLGASESAPPISPTNSKRAPQPLNASRYWRHFAFAAGIAMFALTLTSAHYANRSRHLEQQLADAQSPHGHVQVALLDTLRGAENTTVVRRDPAMKTLILVIPLAQASGEYQVLLSGPVGTLPISIEKVRPDTNSMLNVAIPSAQLRPGRYIAKVNSAQYRAEFALVVQ